MYVVFKPLRIEYRSEDLKDNVALKKGVFKFVFMKNFIVYITFIVYLKVTL